MIRPRFRDLFIADAALPAALQEFLQRDGGETPTYEITGRSGPPHDPRFEAEVSYQGKPLARGEGHSKKQAEQAAALAALKKLQERAKK